jgi:hypothetical protein
MQGFWKLTYKLKRCLVPSTWQSALVFFCILSSRWRRDLIPHARLWETYLQTQEMSRTLDMTKCFSFFCILSSRWRRDLIPHARLFKTYLQIQEMSRTLDMTKGLKGLVNASDTFCHSFRQPEEGIWIACKALALKEFTLKKRGSRPLTIASL